MNNPVVSIVIPIYNAREELNKLFSSIKKLTYENTEIVLVDDGSVDGSKEVLEELLRKTSVAHKFLSYRVNRGVSYARNMGMEMASGEYITFIDGDDTINCNYIENLLKGMQENAAISAASICQEPIEIQSASFSNLSGFEFLYNSLNGYVCNKIYSLNIIKKNALKFSTDFKYAEDLKFNFDYYRACGAEYTLYFNNVKNYSYEKSSNSVTLTKQFAYYNDLSRVLDYLLNNIRDDTRLYNMISKDFVYNYFKQKLWEKQKVRNKVLRIPHSVLSKRFHHFLLSRASINAKLHVIFWILFYLFGKLKFWK